jgi:hypothetical protein
VPSPTEDPLVAQVFDAKKHDEVARAIAKLSPEEAAFFLHRLEMAIRKRKLQLTGYLVAIVVWLGGMMFALAYYGTHSGFVGWVFLVPFALVGVILYAFGAWAERVAKRPLPEVDNSPGGSQTPATERADVPRAEIRKPR